MKLKSAVKNGKQMWNAFHFPVNNYVRSQYRKAFIQFSTLHLSEDAFTSTRNDWKRKIIYNEIIHKEKCLLSKKMEEEKIKYVEKCIESGRPPKAPAFFMKCMHDSNNKLIQENKPTSETEIVNFPFVFTKKVLTDEFINHQQTSPNSSYENSNPVKEIQSPKTKIKWDKDIVYEDPKKWVHNTEDDEFLIDDPEYDSCHPDIPVSNVPCGGCGALLHCTNPSLPGFMPKPQFVNCSTEELRGKICQRCFFLQEYNLALRVNVNVDEYPQIIAQVKNKAALVVLVVDLLDFPCSIWPDIIDVIGKNKSFFVVGNKIDLLIQDRTDFVKHRKKCLMNALVNMGLHEGNIKHVALISAKTGFGVENLISALNEKWGNRGDVYIVGCTNAGKSTLFNTLIQSDYCKARAVDLLQRATVSQWPGTTLNLLKFPILRTSSWRTAIRMQRLKIARREEKNFEELKETLMHNMNKDYKVSLTGYIGRSFQVEGNSSKLVTFDPDDINFKYGNWCYDTPGVVHEAQILNLLTATELSKVLPSTAIVPRNFKLKAGNTLFIGGLGRLDILQGKDHVWCTVYASSDLPVTITKSEDADFIYQKLLGTDKLAVPFGSEKRMEKWPPLKYIDLVVYGKYSDGLGADVVLSSAGWVAVTPRPSFSCKLRVWTPDRRGIFLRRPCLLTQDDNNRGTRIPGTPAYETKWKIFEKVELRL